MYNSRQIEGTRSHNMAEIRTLLGIENAAEGLPGRACAGDPALALDRKAQHSVFQRPTPDRPLSDRSRSCVCACVRVQVCLRVGAGPRLRGPRAGGS